MGEATKRVRMVIELGPTHDRGIEGVLAGPPWGDSQAFSGWLELLRLLEAAVAPAESDVSPVANLRPPTEVEQDGWPSRERAARTR